MPTVLRELADKILFLRFLFRIIRAIFTIDQSVNIDCNWDKFVIDNYFRSLYFLFVPLCFPLICDLSNLREPSLSSGIVYCSWNGTANDIKYVQLLK